MAKVPDTSDWTGSKTNYPINKSTVRPWLDKVFPGTSSSGEQNIDIFWLHVRSRLANILVEWASEVNDIRLVSVCDRNSDQTLGSIWTQFEK